MPRNDRFRFRYDLRMEAAAEEAEVLLYGEIVSYKWDENDPDVTARDFDKLLKDAKNAGAKKLNLRINSPGGSVYQAIAMRTMLMNSSFDNIRVSIEGLCASAATLFVCLPDVHVSIAEGSSFMIHNPSSIVWGTAADMEKQAAMMHKMEQDDHAMYAKRTGQTEDQIKEWMDAETWFTAREAVQYGFADEVLEAGEIAACAAADTLMLMRDMYRHVPDTLTAKSESTTEPEADAGTVIENNMDIEEDTNMEISEITMDMLRTGNPAVYNEIMQQGVTAERDRMTTIDSLTMPGYEEMAQHAKDDGTDALSFMQQVAAAQRAKGATYMEQRRTETAPAQKVTGGDSGDNDAADEEAELKQFAKDMGEYFKTADVGNSNGMY